MSRLETTKAVIHELTAGIREQSRIIDEAIDRGDSPTVVDAYGKLDGYVTGLESVRKYLP